MLCSIVVITSLVALLNPASCQSTRLQWFDPEDLPAQESADEPTWRLPTKRELGDGENLSHSPVHYILYLPILKKNYCLYYYFSYV